MLSDTGCEFNKLATPVHRETDLAVKNEQRPCGQMTRFMFVCETAWRGLTSLHQGTHEHATHDLAKRVINQALRSNNVRRHAVGCAIRKYKLWYPTTSSGKPTISTAHSTHLRKTQCDRSQL